MSVKEVVESTNSSKVLWANNSVYNNGNELNAAARSKIEERRKLRVKFSKKKIK